MPRPARQLLSQSFYHVMTRGNNRMAVFHSETDYQKYLELLARFKQDHPFLLFHYCLMPNHVHLLVRTNKASDFSVFMKKLNLAYFHYYRRQYGWIGHFWQDRFKSQAVGKDAYFIQCGKYIELNPVRAKIVEEPSHYRFSSYRYYVDGVANALVTDDLFYEGLGKTVQARRRAYGELAVSEIVGASYGKPIWGSDYQRYHEQQKRTYGLRK